jgi:hypothetical protein
MQGRTQAARKAFTCPLAAAPLPAPPAKDKPTKSQPKAKTAT